MMRIIKTARVNMVIPEWVKVAVLKAAEAKGISMTQYILDAVKEALIRDKITPPK